MQLILAASGDSDAKKVTLPSPATGDLLRNPLHAAVEVVVWGGDCCALRRDGGHRPGGDFTHSKQRGALFRVLDLFSPG